MALGSFERAECHMIFEVMLISQRKTEINVGRFGFLLYLCSVKNNVFLN